MKCYYLDPDGVWMEDANGEWVAYSEAQAEIERLRGLVEDAYREGFTADHDKGLYREWMASDAIKSIARQ